MLRDVFYYGQKPNAHPREKFAKNLDDARQKSTTEHFWIINEYCDYRGFDWDFDFEFLPDEDVWAEDHINIWPSQHQKDSGTWLVNSDNDAPLYVYRNDVEIVKRKKLEDSKWVFLDKIDITKFDFSWHPDANDPPYIYKWGCKYYPVQIKHVLEYRAPGATQEKYMTDIVELLPNFDYIVENQKIDTNKFDLSWRPNPLDPPYIYVWGNKYIDGSLKSTLEYHVPGATEKKYMPELIQVLPEQDRWQILENIDKSSFDFSWRPDPREPAYIYVFGNEYYDAVKKPTVEYHCEGATERKYMDSPVAKLAPNPKLYQHLENSYLIDYTWLPDPDSPPYIYAWGNQWNKPEDKISVQFVVEGATEYKFMDTRAIRKPCMDNWHIPKNVDVTGFDFSWEPSPADPPFIYEFGTQHQKTGGPQYIVEGATEKKYIDFQKVKALPTVDNWIVPDNIDTSDFDFSWHPDTTDPLYIYQFGTQWALSGGPKYVMPGATEVKYIDTFLAKALANKENWEVPAYIDVDSFDFSWHPYAEDEPFIYQFGTQHQKTGGPRYITPGVHKNSAIKYIDTRILKAKRLPNKRAFAILNNYKIKDFDFSWHPDTTEEPYIYVFGNTQYGAEIMPTIEYVVPGAKQIKYVSDVIATLDVDMNSWEVPDNIDTEGFDFSWKPNPKDPPFIYEFGTQHQKTGGPQYIVPDATEVKYVDTMRVKALPTVDNWEIPSNIDIEDFDFSWHPDTTDPLYIYQFGTQWALSGGPKYIMPGAKEVKYMDTMTAKSLPNKENWEIPAYIDIDSFDFSWHPYAEDEPYIYQFGTQHQKTGGPKYITPGVHKNSAIKYIDTRILKANRLPNKKAFAILNNYKIKDFDWSWHPDTTDEPYIYVFGNNQYPAEIMPTIEYVVPGATQIKYVSDVIATLDVDMNNWEVSKNIDVSDFDFSWKPNPKDPPFIYEFGTQWQTNGGPRYVVGDATDVKYIDTQKAKAIVSMRNWEIPNNVDIEGFDFSWHPDNTNPPYIYVFGTQWALSGGPKYVMPEAKEKKYVENVIAKANPNFDNWIIPDDIDKESFDFSWHPYAEDEPYIYIFGTQWQKTGGPKYVAPGADSTSFTKYIDTRILKAKKLPVKDNWVVPKNIDESSIDFSWHPDDTEPAYIYEFSTTLYDRGGPKYYAKGATENKTPIKYITDIKAKLKFDMSNWEIPNNIDVSGFDFSWVPHPDDPPYIYQFGTQWQKTGGPKYIVSGATEVKYVDLSVAKRLPNVSSFNILNDYKIKSFDYSWHPDETEEPYIYVFGNDRYPAEEMPTIEYVVEGATTRKYVNDIVATLDINMSNWYVPNNVDISNFDFSWIPNPNDPAYIYEFGTQWQKTGGPKYKVEGATEIKYVDMQKVKVLANQNNFEVIDSYKIKSFDYSWHPDSTEEPYIYVFGNNQYPAEVMPTLKYVVDGATQVKYINEIVAKLDVDMSNWEVPSNVDTTGFDFSWIPNPNDPAYIYEFGTQWQKTGGPKYIVHNATETKYIDTQKVKASPNQSNFDIVGDCKIKSFDYSWHPDSTEEPYIYVFGNKQYASEIMPTIQYVVKGAVSKKYINDIVATLDVDMTNWYVPKNIDVSKFDFSWIPNPNDPAYIYEFGTQWQKTGGPKYKVEGATETKYIDSQRAIMLPNKKNWQVEEGCKIKSFDYSWHPDSTEEPYVYIFGNNYYSAEIMPTIKYVAQGAKQAKYIFDIVATLDVDMTNWIVPDNISSVDFDYGWVPNPHDQPYIYQFGTQWQKTDGPKYVVSGATQIKYIDTQKVKRLQDKSNFTVLDDLEVLSFDYSWHPDSTDEPYIYVFGNTQYSAEEMPTIEYRVPGATQKKFVYDNVVQLAPNKKHWTIPDNIDTSDFDFSWIPNPHDEPYIYEFGTQWQKTGGPKYVVPGATQVKYIYTQKAKRLQDNSNYTVLDNLEVLSFDYSWHPDSTEEPYIYVFGNNQYSAEEMPTIEYRVPGATQRKFVHDVVAKLAPDKKYWTIPDNIDTTDFDFSWRPNPHDPAYIYQFATQWQKTGGPVYTVPNATEIKYIDIKAKRLADSTNFVTLNDLEILSFDYSWHPDDTEEPYIYVFGNNQYAAEEMATIEYRMPGATQRKFVHDLVAKLAPDKKYWSIPDDIDITDADFSWRPNPHEKPYIYQFGTQHQKTNGPKYIVPGAIDIKYVNDFKFVRKPSLKNWDIPYGIDVSNFDFSWHPDETSPPYVYQFGTLIDNKDGPKYICPDNTGEVVYLPRVISNINVYQELKSGTVDVKQYYIETTLENLVHQHPNEVFWALNKNIDYSSFDFDWRPEIINASWESEYVNVFGSPDSEATQTYFVNARSYLQGKTSLKFVEDAKLNEEYLSRLFVKPDMFYVDRGNKESTARFEQLKAIYGQKIQKTRYLNSWVDTINRCINRASTTLCWILNSELDYSNFNFDYYPNPWQMKMVHVFGTQWSHWGTTFLVNRETFSTDTKYIKIIEHLSNLNFVKDQNKRALASSCLYDVFFIDFGNREMLKTFRGLQGKIGDKSLTTVQYSGNYLDTFKEILKSVPDKKENYIWICSSICDYTEFDFSYICDPFAREQLHVFPSDRQKYGDTFLVNVNKLRELIDGMQSLQEYNKVNFNQHMRVHRYDPPVIVSEYDTHVASVLTDYDFPYAVFVTEENKDLNVIDYEPMNLWDAESKAITITSTGGTRIIAPKEVKNHIETQLYDYPYIKKTERLAKSKPLDVVYLSNGEKGAEENYEHLIYLTKDLENRVVRVDGVNGRVAAYHAAAEASETPWMFTVFAKLKVSPRFDFNWQPDRLQIPKHYMFNAKNPLNGLVYGHQGIIAYNKKLVLANEGHGLDFTLDDPHESVNMLSGTANFNTDEYSTWRTAFREVIKLRHDTSDISKERLEKWLTVADGKFAEYCLNGANDAIEYYESVNGDYSKLKLSYEWKWLNEYFTNKYKSVISL